MKKIFRLYFFKFTSPTLNTRAWFPVEQEYLYLDI